MVKNKKFDVKKTIIYWCKGADYDLETAESLFESGRYPYALFFGHLALEKLFKALVVKKAKEHAPYTHSLPLLASLLSIKIPEDINKKLDKFMEFHFEARYPEEQKNFYRKCTKRFAEKGLQEIKEVYKWLKEKL
jgi:HEPN domain-containing protein